MAGTDVHNRTAAGPWGPVRQRGAGKLGRVLNHLLDLLLPVDCGGCGVPGAVLCGDCEALLGAPIRVHPPSCPATPPVYALGTYHGPLRAAVLAYKERGRRDLATPLGTALASALLHPHIAHPSPTWSHIGVEPATKSPICLHVGKEIWMVPVPSTPAAAGRRGGQHVALLARRAAAALAGAGVAAAVAPALPGRVLARRAGLPPAGTPVVLVDDVVTTGATAAACTAALVRTGIAVSAIVVLAAAGRHTAL
jgi:predicted amidophosphoribosyltransferase